MLSEILDPSYLREIQERLLILISTLQNITRVGFDAESRIRARVEYIDDGYIRVMDTARSIDILEMLKEFSWTLYNLSETNSLLSKVIKFTDTLPNSIKSTLIGTEIMQPIDIQDHWVENVIILPSASRTASGNTGDIDVGRFICAEVCLDITAVSGTSPVLNVYLEGKDQLSGKYKVIWSVENISSTSTHWLTITTLAFRYIRARWTISGTSPSFTFSIGMEAKS